MPPSSPRQASLEEAALRSVVEQPLGTGTVADLGLPGDFLSRAGDRIIRADYQRRYPSVAEDAPAPTASESAPAVAFGIGYAVLALLLASWLALRARRAGR